MTLPRLFEWYRKDFATTNAGLLEWIATYVPTSVAGRLSSVAHMKDLTIHFE